jgi:hypothetical protein
MDEELEGMGIQWGEELIPMDDIESLVDAGMTPDEAIPFAMLLARFGRCLDAGKGMTHEETTLVSALTQHCTRSLLVRLTEQRERDLEQWGLEVTAALQPSDN